MKFKDRNRKVAKTQSIDYQCIRYLHLCAFAVVFHFRDIVLSNSKLQTPNSKLLVFLIPLLISSCANIVTPTGGPKDEKPPLILEASPENLSTRFKAEKITILFDEYIKLDNPMQEVVISPAIEPEPKFKVKGKKLEIYIKDAKLDSNTTYAINFGESLKDVNESNPLSGFQYVFTTGEKLDSLSVSGKVMLAVSDKPAQKVLVMLHREMSDSAFMKKKPFYFAKTDNSGNFRINYIRHGEYRFFALKDENFNYMYDLPNEEIAFVDSVLIMTENVDSVKLNLFKEEREIPLKRTSISDSKPGFIRLIYSKGVDSIEVNSLDEGLPVALPEYNATRDTITAWYSRAIDTDSIRLVVNKDSIEDLPVRNIPESDDSLRNMFSELKIALKDSLITTEGIFSVLFNAPVTQAELGLITVEQDSPRAYIEPTVIRFSEGSMRQMEIDFPRKPDAHYSIEIPAGALTGFLGAVNETLRWNVKTKADDEYGTLKISITGQQNNYIMMLINAKNDDIFAESIFTEDIIIELKRVPPGSYEIRVIYDANGNGKWDTGNFLQRIQPEKVYAHPEKINVRANWEMEAELKLK